MSAKIEERIAIGDLMEQLCERLGFDYHVVKEIVFHPDKVTAIQFARNENGSPYIGDDGYAVTETLEIEVST